MINLLFLLFLFEGGTDDVFWLKQTSIDEIIQYEKSNNSKFLTKNEMITHHYLPDINKYKLAKPIIAERKNTALPLYAQYYYSQQDSILRCVIYDFELGRYGNYNEKEKIWKKEAKRLEFYNSLYNKFRKNLTEHIGTPISTDNEPVKVKSTWDNEFYLNRDSEWNNDILNVKLNLIFADNTYRIRYSVYWK